MTSPAMTSPAMIPPAMPAALETRALCKDFGGLVVTNAVDFRLEVGARHALIGPNGAGKTTFVNLLTGRLSASSGAILLNGRDVTRTSMDARVRYGLARTFQINQLLSGLPVLENVQLAVLEREGAGGRWWPARAAQKQAAEEAFDLLTRLDLDGVALSPVRALPYGRQRLVEVAVALALKPAVLLLDEPAAGVPPGESRRMMDLIAAMPDDIAVLVIEHDMDLVFRFARRITVLAQGAVLMEGTPREIAGDPRVREVYLGGHGHG